jgi:hypothetical protein
MENISAKKIQLQYRISQITKNMIIFKNYNVIESAQNLPFDKFKKVILDKTLLESVKKLLETINNYKKGIETNPRIFLTAYLISFYDNDLLGPNEDRHFSDDDIYTISKTLVELIENYDEKKINEFCNYYFNYHYAFKNWISMDKARTIERAIVSYYYRSEHIDKINNDLKNAVGKADLEEQLLKMLSELENQRKDILRSIKIIDHTFDLEYFKENYKYIYASLEKSWSSLVVSLSNNMKKAYYDMLCFELNKGNKLPIYNLLKEIGERLLLITPERRKESMSLKFADDKLSDLVIYSDWTSELIEFINFIIDLIILLGAPIDDNDNKQWKISVNELMKDNYISNLPKILIMCEEKIDKIYQQIIDFNENNK